MPREPAATVRRARRRRFDRFNTQFARWWWQRGPASASLQEGMLAFRDKDKFNRNGYADGQVQGEQSELASCQHCVRDELAKANREISEDLIPEVPRSCRHRPVRLSQQVSRFGFRRQRNDERRSGAGQRPALAMRRRYPGLRRSPAAKYETITVAGENVAGNDSIPQGFRTWSIRFGANTARTPDDVSEVARSPLWRRAT